MLAPLSPSFVKDAFEIPKDLLVSAITGIVLWVGRGLAKRAKNWRIKNKYPIAGEYITYYKDHVGKEVRERKATMTLQQAGRTFKGTTKNVDDSREWTLEGTILADGFLSGTYGRETPMDPSRGGFFMVPTIEAHGTYTGYWTGFDSMNRVVDSGEYTWRQVLPVKIRTLDTSHAKHAPRILAIFADALGERFITSERLKRMFDQEQLRFVQAAFSGSKLVGVRTAHVLSADELREFESRVRAAGGHINLKNQVVGMLASNAVERGFRRLGVGSSLIRSGLKLLREKGCTKCVAVSWESGAIESSKSVLESHGFSCVATIERFWETTSLQNDYDCPRCGRPPCSCTARLYERRLLD